MADESAMRDQAEAFLAEARARQQEAQAQGKSYAVALQRTRAAQALVLLDRADEALTDLDAALDYITMLRADGDHERQRLLHMTSASLPPAGQDLGDLDALEGWVRVGRAAALTRLGRWTDARVAVDEARPWTRGFTRRQLRKQLDAMADEIARADGAGAEAVGALDRTLRDQSLPEGDRRRARYERAAHLADDGHYDEAMREALMVIRDADDDPALTARARQVLGAALAAQGLDDEADATLRAAFDGFRSLEDHPAVLTAAPGLAWRLMERGRPQQAIEILDAALPSARALADRGAEADLLAARGTAYDAAGDMAQAVASFDASVTVAEAIPDSVRAADARHGEAIVRGRGDNAHESVEALALLDSAASAYAEAGLPERAAECNHEAASVLGRLGSYDAARQRYASARAAYLEIPEILRADDPDAIPDCDFNLRVLDSVLDGSTAPSALPPDAFGSGGHQMQHHRAGAST
jgi:tetratricopeptide (TPR) repeat protein